MVRDVAKSDPVMARNAMAGLRLYGCARRETRMSRPSIAQQGRVKLLQIGAAGPPVVIIPSLINPSHILDLSPNRSFAGYLADLGYCSMIVDWGHPGKENANETIAEHLTSYLVPILADLGEPVHLIGYCLGGTMAIAIASLLPALSLTLIATPWHFTRYPPATRASLMALWERNAASVTDMGVLPIEILQTAFWGMDPAGTVAKFSRLARLSSDDPKLMEFCAIEDWTNSGAPLTAGAATDLFENFIANDVSGAGKWVVGGAIASPSSLRVRTTNFTATNDRIAPAACAPDYVPTHACPSGHVGMIAGSRAISGCWEPVKKWLDAGG
jgi:polyhydroxyalkanoate synthase